MILAIFLVSVFTILVWLFNKVFSKNICPICAGVVLTWAGLFAGIWLGFLPASRYELVIAILMGASIGGIVTEFKKVFLKFKVGEKSVGAESLENKLKDCC